MPFRPDRLRALREAKGLSQEDLGKLAGLSHSLVAKSENGKSSPRSEALDKLALALDCTIDYLHGRGYEHQEPQAAAAYMAFDVFVTQQGISNEYRERCHRVLKHPDAPKTAQAWRSLAEMIELAIEPTPSTNSLAFVVERRPKSKPTALGRRR